MQHQPVYADVVGEVNRFLGERLERLRQAGVAPEHVVLDPGLGFGKSVEHNLQLLLGLRAFTNWHRPVLLGASRKSFLERAAGAAVADRLPASLACACWAIEQGVNILRVHDVEATRQAVRVTEALLAQRASRPA